MSRSSRFPATLFALPVVALALALTGCADESLRTYVSGWDGISEEQRATLNEYQAANRLTLLDSLDDEEQQVDYIVLAPMPRAAGAPADGEAPREVLDRMEWFGMLSSHDHAQTIARERGITVMELSSFLEMLAAEAAEPEPAADETVADSEG